MLDNKKTGIIISSLRKSFGYTQEKLAELLSVTPQAVSKWENGHALPDTALLPMIAQIFKCTIDQLIMPAYLPGNAFPCERIENERVDILDLQAEHIAKYTERLLTKRKFIIKNMTLKIH